MKKSFILFSLLLTCLLGFGQNRDSTKYFIIPKNSIYHELFGLAPLYSINYERIVYNKKKFYLSGRAGINFLYFGTGSRYGSVFQISVPLSLNELFRTGEKTFFEMGCGLTYIYCPYFINALEGAFGPTITLGGRYHGRKGFLYRFGFTPIIVLDHDRQWFHPIFLPLFGISFGYNFEKNKK